MRHGAAEIRLGRAERVDMDELVVLGHIGKGVDPRLIHHEPRRDAQFTAHGGFHLCPVNLSAHRGLLFRASLAARALAAKALAPGGTSPMLGPSRAEPP